MYVFLFCKLVLLTQIGSLWSDRLCATGSGSSSKMCDDPRRKSSLQSFPPRILQWRRWWSFHCCSLRVRVGRGLWNESRGLSNIQWREWCVVWSSHRLERICRIAPRFFVPESRNAVHVSWLNSTLVEPSVRQKCDHQILEEPELESRYGFKRMKCIIK